MKTKILILAMISVFLVAACGTGPATEASAPQNPINPPATETSVPNTPEVIQGAPEVSTSVALNALPPIATETLVPGGNSISESGVILDDNGKTFNLKVGDSFLLNLGIDTYDWTVTVDNESVLRMKMGVMVIKGAQGIYDALAPGTAILSATGDPHCRQSKPACGAPSILFTITVIVK
jgi:hypothetical protein